MTTSEPNRYTAEREKEKVLDKEKGKVYECEDYLSGVGQGACVRDLEHYVLEAHRVSLAISTGIIDKPIQIWPVVSVCQMSVY